MKKLISLYFLIFTLSIPSPLGAWDVGSWAGVRKISGDLAVTVGALGTSSADGLALINPTPAAAGSQQISPRTRWSGKGWKTDATAASQPVDWIVELVPVQGAANPQARLDFNYQINGAGYQATPTMSLLNGNVGIRMITPTAFLHFKAGTATAGTAPLKFNSGPLNTTPEVGAVEFLTDSFYGTITTGAARKTFAFLESPSFTTPNIGVATATSIAIGANILDTNEWVNLDGLNQILATTSTPQFTRMGLGGVAHAAIALDIVGSLRTTAQIQIAAVTQANMIVDAGGISGTDDDSQILFRRQGNNVGRIQYDEENDTFNFTVTDVTALDTTALSIVRTGNIGIGTTTLPTASTRVVVADTTQLAARLSLTGQEYYQAANTSTDGIGFVLGVNRAGNRQLWLGDTAALAQNSTNSIIRLTVGGTGTPTIDAIATDGTTTKALAVGNAGGVQYGKATVALGAGVSATLGTIGGSGPTVAGQNSWIQMKDSTGANVWVPAWK